jgi:hypothetical protein
VQTEAIRGEQVYKHEIKINLRFLHINESKLSETEMYTFCFESKETMTHILFYFCTHVHLLVILSSLNFVAIFLATFWFFQEQIK